jgi:ribosomal protein S18 acetylase RimI-like enzyme
MEGNTSNLEIRRIRTTDAAVLGDFFEELGADAETVRFFHPHSLTRVYAALLCGGAATRLDHHYVALYRGRPAAYSLLRGWDDGYAVPSWGGCVHPELRSAGMGHALLLHAVAESRAAGATRLRLTVYKANQRGVHLYSKFGFVFQDKDEKSVVGVLDLTAPLVLPAREPDPMRLQRWYESIRERSAA